MASICGYYSQMKQAQVSDLKNQLSRYLDYVRQGETVLVFDRKIPVAELRPVSDKASSGKLAALERKGVIRRGRGRLPQRFFQEPLGGLRAGVLQALLAEREEER
jgi:antitoxin (DNA-binding transcriptional repressor) of toxin-antitoxin stability system